MFATDRLLSLRGRLSRDAAESGLMVGFRLYGRDS